MESTLLGPIALLVLWTFIVAGWMLALRIPAMKAAGLGVEDARHTRDLSRLPSLPRSVADNYNHLHEQPTLFYAVALASTLAGLGDELQTGLAWAYVGARVVHSFVQNSAMPVTSRLLVFMLASAVLIVMTVRLALAVI